MPYRSSDLPLLFTHFHENNVTSDSEWRRICSSEERQKVNEQRQWKNYNRRLSVPHLSE
jgi:hypothetical protein